MGVQARNLAIGGAGGGGNWKAVPYNAGDYTASAGNWTVLQAGVTAFRYLKVGKIVFFIFNATGATSNVAADLSLTLPFTPLSSPQGFALTNASGSSEAGFYYHPGGAKMNFRRIAGNWPISASFGVAAEFYIEVA